jgi:GTP-binding protein
MAFIDEITFHIKAGNGGDGVERWRHEKGKEYSGAAGGNGGKGGDVYVRAVRDLGILARYRNTKEFISENGEAGMRNSMHGADGPDLIIDLPVGSVVTDMRTVETGGPGGIKKGEGRKIPLLKEGELVRILKGGNGGLGNEHFKASTNVRPTQTTDGKPGEEGDFAVELELLADAGFVGLPNAGKSSLLNALTNTNVKVGSYQFTTLEPNLGALQNFILADIPGLIEGASEGKGLGHKFLRHIKRTKRLFHLISLEHAVDKKDGSVLDVYKTIRGELERYGQGLADKPETIILTKTDVFGTDAKAITKEVEKIKKELKKELKLRAASAVLSVTILDDASVKTLADEIVKQLRVVA